MQLGNKMNTHKTLLAEGIQAAALVAIDLYYDDAIKNLENKLERKISKCRDTSCVKNELRAIKSARNKIQNGLILDDDLKPLVHGIAYDEGNCHSNRPMRLITEMVKLG